MIFFLPKSASSVSWSQALDGQLVLTPEQIELCMASCQGLYAKFGSMMSSKCSIVENNGELMLMALHTHFILGCSTAAIFSDVRTVFGFSRFAGLSMRMPVSFTFFTS